MAHGGIWFPHTESLDGILLSLVGIAICGKGPPLVTQTERAVAEKEQKAVCEAQVKDRKDLLQRKQGHVASDQLPDQLLQGTRCFALPIAYAIPMRYRGDGKWYRGDGN